MSSQIQSPPPTFPSGYAYDQYGRCYGTLWLNLLPKTATPFQQKNLDFKRPAVKLSIVKNSSSD